MDDARFTDMGTCSSSTAPSDSSWSGVSAMRVTPCEAMASAGTWGYALVGQCVSRVQFNEEHQRSLLSCRSTEGAYSFPDDAMLELRRRVLKVEADSHRLPTFAKDLEYTHPIQQPYEPKRSQSFASRWEKRKAKALALKQQQQAVVQPMPTGQQRSNNSQHTLPKAFKTLLSDTEKALDSILGKSDDGSGGVKPIPPHTGGSDVRRLSVDELLSMRPSLATSTCSSSTSSGSFSPEKTGAECVNNQVDDPADEPKLLSPDAQMLRAWLADMDPQRPGDYHAYARDFRSQGFHALEDLAELDEHDVEQAMSEIGIAKFAHRARIHKAILRLRSDTFQDENSSSLLNSS